MAKKIIENLDSVHGMANSKLVSLSKELLDAVVQSSGIRDWDSAMNESQIKEARIVLGFLNSTDRLMKTKLQVFRMTGLDKKLEAVKEHSSQME